MTNTAKNIRIVRSRTVLLKRQRLALQARRAPSAARPPRRPCVMKSVASPMATPGLRLKKSVTLVNWFKMVHRLRPERRFPGDQRIQRHESLAVVRSDVEQRKILRFRARRSCRFQNHLILIFRLLDQVEIVLRVGVAQQRQYARLRYAVRSWPGRAGSRCRDWACCCSSRMRRSESPDTSSAFHQLRRTRRKPASDSRPTR